MSINRGWVRLCGLGCLWNRTGYSVIRVNEGANRAAKSIRRKSTALEDAGNLGFTSEK